MGEPNAEEPSTSFRRVKKRPRAIRQQSVEAKSPKKDAGDEEEDISARLSDIHEAQTTRKRRNGMTALECALGKKLASEFDDMDDDPFKMRGGKMLELSEDKKLVLEAAGIESDIKEQFKKETLLRDEHEEMRKYIDQRLNRETEPLDIQFPTNSQLTTTEDMILMKVADQLRGFQSKANEELLSNQMLVGIPEVDLGIDVRIQNVMETEKRKTELLGKSKHRPEPPSDF